MASSAPVSTAAVKSVRSKFTGPRDWHNNYAERVQEVAREEVAVSLQAKVAEFRAALPEVDKRWKAHDVRDQLQNSSLLTFAMVGFAHEYDAIKRKLTDELGKPRHLKVA